MPVTYTKPTPLYVWIAILEEDDCPTHVRLFRAECDAYQCAADWADSRIEGLAIYPEQANPKARFKKTYLNNEWKKAVRLFQQHFSIDTVLTVERLRVEN